MKNKLVLSALIISIFSNIAMLCIVTIGNSNKVSRTEMLQQADVTQKQYVEIQKETLDNVKMIGQLFDIIKKQQTLILLNNLSIQHVKQQGSE